jgi:hypothetical protein
VWAHRGLHMYVWYGHVWRTEACTCMYGMGMCGRTEACMYVW